MESLRRTLSSLSLALLVHGLLFGVLVLGFGWNPHSKPISTNSVSIVQARVVNKDKILAEMGRQQRATPEPQQVVTSEPQKTKQQIVKAQRQQQEIVEQVQQEAKKQRELEQKRQQEQARLKQLEMDQKAKEEAHRRAEIERKQKQAEEEKKQQAEAKRRLEEEKRQAEVAKRKAEEERKEAEAARRRAEDARRQQELQASIDAEQSTAQAKAAIERFIPQLQMRVQRYWIRPPSARDNMVAVLQVELLPSGDVRDVKIVESSGDRTFDRSAQAAVYRASPLPLPTDSAAAAKLQSFNFKFCPGSSC
ncbi:MAG: cell envelope integrity protein TolA [Candidatus Nitrosoglobus sp.]|jgi:colicin import membrane protein